MEDLNHFSILQNKKPKLLEKVKFLQFCYKFQWNLRVVISFLNELKLLIENAH